MKVLHIIFSLNIGGAETMLVDILNRQIKENQNIALLIINNEYNEALIKNIHKSIQIFYVQRKPKSKNVFDVIRFNKIVMHFKPDIIHAHDYNVLNYLLYKKALTLLTLHTIGFRANVLNKYDCLCAISKAVQKDLFQNLGLNSELVYNGVDFKSITFKTEIDYNDSFKIIQISRLDHEKKGQDILIKSLKYIIDVYSDLNITIDFIGEGESYNYLKSLTVSLGLENYVRFLGLKDRNYIYQHICEYDLLVQPSNYEGFGLTVVEGMAAKIPVLVSANDGPIEIIKEGIYGFYFEKGNIKDCANNIMKIKAMSKGNLVTFVENSYIYASKYFNIDVTAQKYMQIYKEKCNENSSNK